MANNYFIKRVVCRAYKNFYRDNSSIPSYYLRGMLRLILKENSFHFNGPRWAKWQQFPLPIFSSHILKHKFSVSKTFFKPTVWKHHIIDLWDILKSDIVAFFEQANFSETYITIILNSWPKCLTLLLTETLFLDTVTSIQRHMQDSTKNYSWCWDTLNLNKRKPFHAKTNSSEETFEERSISNCKKRLMDRRYPHNLKEKALWGI